MRGLACIFVLACIAIFLGDVGWRSPPSGDWGGKPHHRPPFTRPGFTSGPNHFTCPNLPWTLLEMSTPAPPKIRWRGMLLLEGSAGAVLPPGYGQSPTRRADRLEEAVGNAVGFFYLLFWMPFYLLLHAARITGIAKTIKRRQVLILKAAGYFVEKYPQPPTPTKVPFEVDHEGLAELEMIEQKRSEWQRLKQLYDELREKAAAQEARYRRIRELEVKLNEKDEEMEMLQERFEVQCGQLRAREERLKEERRMLKMRGQTAKMEYKSLRQENKSLRKAYQELLDAIALGRADAAVARQFEEDHDDVIRPQEVD